MGPGLVLDTQGKGLATVLKPYAADILCHLWELDEEWRGQGKNSGYLWAWYNERAAKFGLETRSRASVIFRLNDMVEAGILGCVEKTGKGGYHRVYFPAMTPEEFKGYVTTTVIKTIDRVFGGDRWWELDGKSGPASDTS